METDSIYVFVRFHPMGGPAGMSRIGHALVGVGLVAALAACATSPVGNPGGKPSIVAAENFWGSIASQLGGDLLDVTSVITSPNADPHDYEPTAADARALATARLVIENGIGYDPWVDRLLAANPVPSRVVLNVGDLVGVAPGGNAHQWYSPSSVQRVIDALTTEYTKISPDDAARFDALRTTFEQQDLGAYHALIAAINAKYGGTPVGASESVFEPMARALGLDLLTPPTFLRAISEGTEPTAADKAAIDQQIGSHGIDVYVYNRQNATPDVQRQIDEARAQGIPVATITETLAPATATFEQWQVAEMRGIQDALARATGR
jgi:zinc/manganese transport system substrate-binding protein